VLGGLTIHPLVANFQQGIYSKQEILANAKVSARKQLYIGHNSLNRPPLRIIQQYQRIYTVSQKKRANFDTVYLEIIRIDFDNTWQKYSKYCRIEFACSSFRVGLLFHSTFRLSNRTPKITQILKITLHTTCQHGAIQ